MSIEFNIVESSPQAKEAGAKAKTRGKDAFYPFDQLTVGSSFTVALSACNWKSLRTIVYKRNAAERKNDVRNEGFKQFTFVKHDDLGIVEVARIS